MSKPTEHPSFREALRVWVKIGLLSFGGPAGQISLMHRELVEERRWVSDRRFLHALNYCMLLPGPEAEQLAIYTGWLLHKTRGGVVAGALFVLPGALLMLVISAVYVTFGKLPAMEAVFYGLKAAVMAVVVSAVIKIGKKVLKRPVMWVISAASFIAIFVAGVPFPVIVISALTVGFVFGRKFPEAFDTGSGGSGRQDSESYAVSDEVSANIAPPAMGRTLGTAALWIVVWLLPPVLCVAWLGPEHLLAREGVFFSKAALVTFGGAYAVLPYVAQQAVEVHGWLSATQMMDGLGLAETTPGPLVLVLQFVGFLGGWNHPEGMSPLVTGSLGAAMTIWATFIPGYLFIFVGGPWIERTHGDLRLNTALTAVTAAVVGVILNLAVWFAWNVVAPEPGRFDAIPLVLGAGFLFLIQKRNWGMVPVVGLGAAIGLALYFTGVR